MMLEKTKIAIKDTHYLAGDPGKATGWATADKNGEILRLGTVKNTKELQELLTIAEPKILIVENFKLRPWLAKEQSWSNMPASKIIGAFEMYASFANIPMILQEPSCKETGYMWGGIPKMGNHANSHDKDALAHLIFYMIKNEIKKVTDYVDLS